jgi:amino acid transporter
MNSTRPVASGPVAATLGRDRLGIIMIASFIMCAAAPVTVGAGVIPTGYATTGITGLPLAFLLVGAVLLVFTIGFNAMSRRISNAGAFYAYVAHGLGKHLGVAAAAVALLAYNLLQVGLYGAIGASVSPLMEEGFGLHLHWSVYALIAWAIVAVLGVLRVDINGTILAGLLILEIVVVGIFDIANLAHPAGGSISFETFHPAALFTSGFGALFVIGVTGFVGFEGSAIFSEEARNRTRTVPRAAVLCLTVIAVLYCLTAWSMAVTTGASQISSYAGQQQGETMFALAQANLGGSSWALLGHILFATSLFAAMLSYHNFVGRYAFSLGRENVLPAWFGKTNRKFAPKWASLLQSGVGLLVIVGYAVSGLDPLVQMFFWLGTTGGFGVLILLVATSLAVICYRLDRKYGDSAWRALIAPAVAFVILLAVVIAAIANFPTLLGVPADSPLRWIFPASYLLAALIGLVRAAYLRARHPAIYQRIGLGANAATGRAVVGEAPQNLHEAREEQTPAERGL